MEKKLTPIGELLEWINFIEHKYGGDGVSHIKTKATELLEAEKQEIINARVTSPILPFNDKNSYIEEANKYFTDTYETK